MKLFARRFSWLMIWIGLGVVLLQLVLVCVPHKIIINSRRLMNFALIKDLSFALNDFQTEYGYFPLGEHHPFENDMILDTADTRFVSALLGRNTVDNKKGIAFIEAPLARDDKPGLIKENGSYRLVDPDGHPYQVILDTDGDLRVRNPDMSNTQFEIRSTASEWLEVKVAIFSLGEDGLSFTGDDLTSWREMPPRGFISKVRDFFILAFGHILAIIGILGVFFLPRNKSASPVSHAAPS